MKNPTVTRTAKQAAKSSKGAIQSKVAKNNKAVGRKVAGKKAAPRGKR